MRIIKLNILFTQIHPIVNILLHFLHCLLSQHFSLSTHTHIIIISLFFNLYNFYFFSQLNIFKFNFIIFIEIWLLYNII